MSNWTIEKARALHGSLAMGPWASAESLDALRWALDEVEHRDRCVNAHLDGTSARLDNKPYRKNPYRTDTDESLMWNMGWSKQDDEIRLGGEVARLSVVLRQAEEDNVALRALLDEREARHRKGGKTHMSSAYVDGVVDDATIADLRTRLEGVEAELVEAHSLAAERLTVLRQAKEDNTRLRAQLAEGCR